MGVHQPQKELFSYPVDLDKRVRADHPLGAIAAQIDFNFFREEVASRYGNNGNASLKTAGEIAVSGSLQEKRVLAGQVFGSNLVLDGKKARGCCVKPWSLLVEKSSTGGMVGWPGLEPGTNGLKGRCSTD
jgi:hypothetical protein